MILHVKRNNIQPELSWEWQGVDRKHITGILRHGRMCALEWVQAYSVLNKQNSLKRNLWMDEANWAA